MQCPRFSSSLKTGDLIILCREYKMNDIVSKIMNCTHKNICLNITNFVDLLQGCVKESLGPNGERLVIKDARFMPITEKESMENGHYANLTNGTKIWVSRHITPNHFRVTDDNVNFLVGHQTADYNFDTWSDEKSFT